MPLEQDWINDIFGLLQALLTDAGIVPSGNPDKVGASQYLEAVAELQSRQIEAAALSNWRAETSGTANVLFGITWSGALFVTLGNAGTILTSPDGITWTARTSGTAVALLSAKATGHHLVVGGGSGEFLLSQTGVDWQLADDINNTEVNGLGWSGRVAIAVGSAGMILRSFRTPA